MSATEAILVVQELLSAGVPAVLGEPPVDLLNRARLMANSDSVEIKAMFHLLIEIGKNPRVVYIAPSRSFYIPPAPSGRYLIAYIV
jgi:hypothetical protein